MKQPLVLFAAAVTLAAATPSAARPALQLHPTQVRFGSQPFESFTERSLEIENRSADWVRVTVEPVSPPGARA